MIQQVTQSMFSGYSTGSAVVNLSGRDSSLGISGVTSARGSNRITRQTSDLRIRS